MTSLDSCALLSCRIFSTLFIRKKFLCLSVGRPFADKRYVSKTTMELVSIPPVLTAYRQALQTFDDKLKKDFPSNFAKLKTVMDAIKADDLGFDKMLTTPEAWRQTGKAPCTYIEVFQNSRINMSIFVLKPGFKMPLHDHPQMHGLLKVIYGAVHIRSFSEYPLKEPNTINFTTRAAIETARLAHGVHKRRRLFAQVATSKVCKANSEACVLTPTISNYHEIQALELPAAFFDILSPPYDTLIEGIGPRRCHYYRIVNELSSNVVELQETDVPECFYCDQAPYLGPVLGKKKKKWLQRRSRRSTDDGTGQSVRRPIGFGTLFTSPERKHRHHSRKCIIV